MVSPPATKQEVQLPLCGQAWAHEDCELGVGYFCLSPPCCCSSSLAGSTHSSPPPLPHVLPWLQETAALPTQLSLPRLPRPLLVKLKQARPSNACPRPRCTRLLPRPGRTRALFSLVFARYSNLSDSGNLSKKGSKWLFTALRARVPWKCSRAAWKCLRAKGFGVCRA